MWGKCVGIKDARVKRVDDSLLLNLYFFVYVHNRHQVLSIFLRNIIISVL
jgi:hypothetical protein